MSTATVPPLASTARDPRLWPEGLYVHLPFCAAICTYCAFASEIYSAERPRRYLGLLERELATRVAGLSRFTQGAAWDYIKEGRGATHYAPRTIFLGGGTPSALNLDELRVFFDALARHVDCSQVEEFTIEANPGSTEAQKLEFLLSRGVNRISFGVQSFQPHLLKLLGRVHGATQGREAVSLARAAGFTNVSIDLMHGLPTQSREDLDRDLDEALALNVDHISAYGLMYEDGTPLKAAVERGQTARLAPEEEAAHYVRVMERLEAGGLPQYEISNYAKPGREAQHNLIYWRNEAYLGVGVSAAGCVGGERYTNHYEMNDYQGQLEQGRDPVETRETLSGEAKAREALVLELRLRRGVDAQDFARRWGVNPELDEPLAGTLKKFASLGLMERTSDGRWRIAQASLPVADGILSELV